MSVTKRLAAVAALFLGIHTVSTAGEELGSDGPDPSTIKASDFPKDAPQFREFPARRYLGKNASLHLGNDSEARLYRTRVFAWSKEKPNFAGHYVLATWGCGTECTQLTIIDVKSGKVYQPEGLSTISANKVDGELTGGNWFASGVVRFVSDSRMLILLGTPEERNEDRGVSYYVWGENHRLKRIRFVPKP